MRLCLTQKETERFGPVAAWPKWDTEGYRLFRDGKKMMKPLTGGFVPLVTLKKSGRLRKIWHTLILQM